MAGNTASETQNEAPRGDRPSNTNSSPPMKLILYFTVAVVIGLTLQKAIPAVDVALSCHSKVVCSAHFVGHRSLDSIDIGSVRCTLHLFSSDTYVSAIDIWPKTLHFSFSDTKLRFSWLVTSVGV